MISEHHECGSYFRQSLEQRLVCASDLAEYIGSIACNDYYIGLS